MHDAFKCSSDCPISIAGKSLLRLQCVHVHHVGMWEQHGCKNVAVLYVIAQSI